MYTGTKDRPGLVILQVPHRVLPFASCLGEDKPAYAAALNQPTDRITSAVNGQLIWQARVYSYSDAIRRRILQLVPQGLIVCVWLLPLNHAALTWLFDGGNFLSF